MKISTQGTLNQNPLESLGGSPVKANQKQSSNYGYGMSQSMPNSPHGYQKRVIHKTLNGIITEEHEDYIMKKQKKEEYVSNKGWKAPLGTPYLSLGQFANVAEAFESMKSNLPNTSQLQSPNVDIETLRNLRTVKRLYNPQSLNAMNGIESQNSPRSQNTSSVVNSSQHRKAAENSNYNSVQQSTYKSSEDKGFLGGVAGMTKTVEAGRVMNILKNNQDDLIKINSKQIESKGVGTLKSTFDTSKFSQMAGRSYRNSSLVNTSDLQAFKGGQQVDRLKSQDQKLDQSQIIQQSDNIHFYKGMNNRIHSPSLKRLIMTETDGNYILKQEILDSMKRVKAAKKGFNLNSITPFHEATFYLPNQKDYFSTRTSPTKLEPLDDSQRFKLRNNKMAIVSQDKSRIVENGVYLGSQDRKIGNPKKVSINQSFDMQSQFNTFGNATDFTDTSTFITSTRYMPNSKQSNNFINQSMTYDSNRSPNMISIDDQQQQDRKVQKQSNFLESLDQNQNTDKNERKKGIAIDKVNINSIKMQSGMPRIPQRYNELAIQHQSKIQEIIDQNLKKSYEKISEEARKEKVSVNQNTDQVILSTIDMKPIQPYLKLVPLKDLAYMQLAGKKPSTSTEKKQNQGNISQSSLESASKDSKSKANFYSKLEKDLEHQYRMRYLVNDQISHKYLNFNKYIQSNQSGQYHIKKKLDYHLSSMSVDKRRIQRKPTIKNVQKFVSNNSLQVQHPLLPSESNQLNVSLNASQQLSLKTQNKSNHLNENQQRVYFEEESFQKEYVQFLSQYFDMDFLKEIAKDRQLLQKLYNLCSNKFSQSSQQDQQINKKMSFSLDVTPTSPRRNHSKNFSQATQQESKQGINNTSAKKPKEGGGGSSLHVLPKENDESLIRSAEERNQIQVKQLAFLVDLLEEMLNPSQKDLVELDSVYQLKNLVKKFYTKKNELCDRLIKKLDSIMTARPELMNYKKTHFFKSYEAQVNSNLLYTIKLISIYLG
eukprot:403357318